VEDRWSNRDGPRPLAPQRLEQATPICCGRWSAHSSRCSLRGLTAGRALAPDLAKQPVGEPEQGDQRTTSSVSSRTGTRSSGWWAQSFFEQQRRVGVTRRYMSVESFAKARMVAIDGDARPPVHSGLLTDPSPEARARGAQRGRDGDLGGVRPAAKHRAADPLGSGFRQEPLDQVVPLAKKPGTQVIATP
jgi:hypothetical protein